MKRTELKNLEKNRQFMARLKHRPPGIASIVIILHNLV
jgi:hypothetical protein